MSEVNIAYSHRAVDVVRAALTGDKASLSQWVAPTAAFTIFQGDVGKGPRTQGPTAAVEFFEDLRAIRYEFATGSGPFSMDPCGNQKAEIAFYPAQSGQKFEVRFSFKDAVLVSAEGSALNFEVGPLNKNEKPDG